MGRGVTSLFIACATVCLLCVLAGRVRAEEPMVPLPGSHPAHFDFRNRPALPTGMKLPLELIFATKHKAELEALVREIEDPKSPLYRHGLTSEEIHRRFGESQAEFDAVEQWLQSEGFKITRASYGKSTDYIYFSGTVAQAEKTFRVTIVSATPGKYASTTDAMIPERFKGVIGSILGLDNFGGGFMLRPFTSRPANPAAIASSGAGRGLSAIPKISIGGITGFAPKDFYTFYGEAPLINAGINGSGTKCIALIEQSDFHDAAVDEFDSTFGVIAPNPNPIPRVSSSTLPFYNTEESETLLDVEWAHAVAPGAPLKVYPEDPTNPAYVDTDFAILQAVTNAVTDNTCGVIAISYANCDHSLDSDQFDTQFIKAAGQMQTVLIAAGDAGAAWHVENPDGTCGPVATTRNVNELSADPNVTSCGGTQSTPRFDSSGNDIGFVPEFVWDEPTRPQGPGATGGGASAVFLTKPPWQVGLGVPADGKRDVPDVAMMASPDMPGVFFFEYQNGAPVLSPPVAGTSLCPPTWGGITSLVSEAANGAAQGFINKQIYMLGTLGGIVGFRDVLLGDNGFNNVPGFPATFGYDQSTGWGTPDITSFVNSPNFVSVNLLICGGCTDTNCGMGNSIAACQKYNLATASFTSTGSMANSRGFFPSVLLADGTTLLPGGWENFFGSINPEGVVEIFNPSTGKVTSAAGMHYARAFHTGTRLDDGRVLVTGGLNSGTSTALKNGETYDPIGKKWTVVSNNMVSTRYDHSGTLLNDGRVLLAGGLNSTPAPLKTDDVFDPIANTFSQVGSMVTARRGHSAVVLPGGKVLITGGANNCTTLSSAELFDPSSNSFSATGNMTQARAWHTSTLLPNGLVLIAGGAKLDTSCNAVQLKSAELYNPANNTFTAISSMNAARLRHSAIVLHSGNVLVAGGFAGCSSGVCWALKSGEIFDPSANTFTLTPNLPTATGGFAANVTR